MAATAADIARYTTDGITVVSPVNPATVAAIKAAFSDAQDGSETEIEHFFDTEADSQAMLDELFAILSQVNPPYLAIETDSSIGLGTTVPIAPIVPSFTVTDGAENVIGTLRVRGYAFDSGTDRYSVELIK